MLTVCIFAMGTFILTPNVVKADNSGVELYLETPIDLNPKLEWEAAIIDGYIPIKSNVKVKTTTKTAGSIHAERYWFRYLGIISHNGDVHRDDYKSLEKFYYNQHDQKINYGVFTEQYFAPSIIMSIVNDYLVMQVIRSMDRYHSAKYEGVIIQIPDSQYKSFFGGESEFDTYYKGVKLKNTFLHPTGNCVVQKERDITSIIISSTGVNLYDTTAELNPAEND